MLNSPFLTELDERARVKGSVDPLGAMAIWSRLGRRVVGNLSTVTTSVKDFKTVVLGFALIRDLKRRAGPDQDVNELAAFLRWEQLAAYTRARHDDWGFRGLRRVRARLADSSVVPLSAQGDAQILGNQKIYGLWGLFTVPSRASGLLQKEVNELTPAAEDFVSRTWKRTLTPIWNRLLDTIAEDVPRFNLERQEALIKPLRAVWSRYEEGEKAFWDHHLVNGGPADKTAGEQRILAGLLRRTLRDDDFDFSQRTVRKMAKQAAAEDEQLAAHLLDIAASESVLAPAIALFAYLQTRDGQRLVDVVDAVRRGWPRALDAVDTERFATLRHHLASSANERVAASWLDLSEDLARGRYEDAISRLLHINELVMESRSGAAWIAEEAGVLRVRYRDEAASLPDASELKDLWRYPYFLESLRGIVQELERS